MIPVLQIQNLSVDFIVNTQAIHALQNISIEVNKGELVALVGESGSGKSVTALSVLRLLSSSPAQYLSGNIFFNTVSKVDLLQCSKEQLQNIRGNHIAMIFQEPMTSLNPVISCGQQVSEAILLHKKINTANTKKQTLELFKQVELPDPETIYKRYPHQLSGGQKQRVMIAMAMSCNPSLLICDEPTTALDVTIQQNILSLIKKFQQQNNMSVIFISHDLSVVANIADRIVVMYKGKIVEEGNTEQIFSSPKHPYTKALLACRPLLHSKTEKLPVVSDFMEINKMGEIIEKNQSASFNIQATKIFEHQAQNKKQEKDSSINKYQSIILSVRNLKVWFPSKTNFFGKVLNNTKAVDEVSFDVYKGETVGLVGGSGSGKTTLGRAVLRLVNLTAGEIYFREQNITYKGFNELRNLRKNMQIIFQDPYSSLNPRKKIGDAIAEPLQVHKLYKNARQQKENVIELLKKISLPADAYNRYPHEFSGGQRQRIVIARALALQPAFVVCDESVSALDVSVQAQVLNLLNDLKKEFKFTAIFISHDLSVVRYVSDRIMVMDKGKIVEVGDAEQLYKHPQNVYTKQLLDSIPKFNY